MKELLFTLYMFYIPLRLRIPQLPLGTIIDIFNVVFLVMLIAGRNPRAVRQKFETPLLVFLLIWVTSYFYAVFQTIQNFGMPVSDITREFKRLITLPLGYFVFARCIKTKKEAQFLFIVFLICVVVMGFYVFNSGMLEGPSFADHKRGSGPFGATWKGSDIAGGFLATFTPFLFAYFLFTKEKKRKAASLCGLVICVLGLLATYSRGCLIAFILGCSTVIWFSLKYLFRHSRLIIIILCLIFAFGVLKWRHWMPQAMITRIDETIETERYDESVGISRLDPGSQNRIEIWKGGLSFFYDHPVTGIGFRQVEYLSGMDPHNSFILIVSEMGIFGLLCFLWFLWRVFIAARSMMGSEFNIIGAGFVGSVVSMVVVNIFYSNFFRDNVVGIFWIVLGILAASSGFITREKQTVTGIKNNQRQKRIISAIVAATLLLTVHTAYAVPESRWWNVNDIAILSAHKDLQLGTGRIYYVDGKNGSDRKSGDSLRTAVKTIGRGIKKLKPGDTLLIKAGRYHDRLWINQKGTEGNRITIGPFGDGEVIIDASLRIGDWIQHRADVYKATCSEKPTAVVVNNKPLFQEFSLRRVDEGKWYYDQNEKMIYLHVPGGGNPLSTEVGVVGDIRRSYGIFLNGAQHLTLYGLTVKYAPDKGIEILGNNNRIERCNIAFNSNSGISMFNYGDKVSRGTEIIRCNIYHNFIRNWPRGRWKNSGWGKGIDGFYVTDTKIIGNIVHKNGGEGIGAPGDRAVIRDNVVFDNWSVNIYACHKKDVLIERNLVFCNTPTKKDLYNNRDKNPNDGKCFRRLRAEGIMTADEKSPTAKDIKIINNIVIGCRRGITHYAGTKGSGMKNVLIAHNTIVVPNEKGNGEDFVGIKIPYNGGNNKDVVIRNNIVYAEHPNNYLLHIKTDPLGKRKPLNGIFLDHNLWYHAKKKKPFHLGPAWFRINDMDFKTWQKRAKKERKGLGSKFADPKFRSEELFVNNGLNLLPKSPAIDAGIVVSGVKNDYDNNERSDGAPDIGAFEFNPGN